MRKVSQKHIKSMIYCGIAVNLNTIPEHQHPPHSSTEKHLYSMGRYGISGGVMQDTDTGQLYAIPNRSTNLFRYF